MIELYHVPGSRSSRVRWLLEELSLDYDTHALALGDGSAKTPEYLALHPLGKVPTLVDDGVAIFESGAIVEYLLERHGDGRLAPAVGDPQRGPFLQWIHFAEASVMPPLVDLLTHRFRLPEAERSEAVVESARLRLRRALEAVEAALAKDGHLVGGAFGAADVMMGFSVHLAKLVGELPEDLSHIAAWYETLSKRPAFEKAFG